MLTEAARTAGFELEGNGLKTLLNPDDAAIARSIDYGWRFALAL